MNTTTKETPKEKTAPAEIEVLTADLKRIVANAQKVIDKRSDIPVLACFRLYTIDMRLHILATDLEIEYHESIAIDTQWANATLDTCIYADRLHKILSTEKAEYIIMHATQDKGEVLHLEGNRKYDIIGLPADEYPVWEKVSKYCAPYTVARDTLGYIIKAVSTDETRFVLNAVLFSKSAIVATDGRRLHWIENPRNICDMSKDENAEPGALVPIKALTVALTIQDACGRKKAPMTFQHRDGTSIIQIKDAGTITTKNIEGTYPNWRQVIPTQAKHKVTVHAPKELHDFCKTWLKLADASSSVKLDGAELSAKSEEGFTMSETIDVTPADAAAICFNPQYMIEATMGTDTSVLAINDEFKPIVITNDDYSAVIMPMRN